MKVSNGSSLLGRDAEATGSCALTGPAGFQRSTCVRRLKPLLAPCSRTTGAVERASRGSGSAARIPSAGRNRCVSHPSGGCRRASGRPARQPPGTGARVPDSGGTPDAGPVPLVRELLSTITNKVMSQTKLPNVFARLYPIVQQYVSKRCFGCPVDLDQESIREYLRNPTQPFKMESGSIWPARSASSRLKNAP